MINFGAPRTTKDGVTVAKEIELKDKFENMGAQMVREAASKTNDVAGDGTTTAAMLVRYSKRSAKAVAAGMNPMDVKKGVDMAAQAVVAELNKMSKKVNNQSEVGQVGTISANGETEIGELIANAMDKVGKEGVITADKQSLETTLDVVEGMQFDRGYYHYFCN